MNKGELVPDELVVEIATDRLKKDDCKDGFPSGMDSLGLYFRPKSWMNFLLLRERK